MVLRRDKHFFVTGIYHKDRSLADLRENRDIQKDGCFYRVVWFNINSKQGKGNALACEVVCYNRKNCCIVCSM
jgi:hypothetical protein